jgi:hypothetical protein
MRNHDFVSDGFLVVTAAGLVLLCSSLLALAFARQNWSWARAYAATYLHLYSRRGGHVASYYNTRTAATYSGQIADNASCLTLSTGGGRLASDSAGLNPLGDQIMETQLSRSKFLRLVAASASLLVLPRGAHADDTEITFDMVVNYPRRANGRKSEQ